MELIGKQKSVFNDVLSGKNVFISGPGGVGKSFIVRYIMDKLGGGTVLLAPTGIAALNIGGSTIHSAFKFNFGVQTKKNYSRINKKTAELFDINGPVKRIVVDEISMVRGDYFTCLDQQLRRIRRLDIPFGGIQVIVVGDFFQLPPVITPKDKRVYFDNYDSPYAFGGSTWSTGNFQYTELDKILRQSDEEFIGHLQKIRRREYGFEESVKFFNEVGAKNVATIEEKDPIYLCTTNADADTINIQFFDDLEGEIKIYTGKFSGNFNKYSTPSPEKLHLKIGTKVMFTANTEQFKNGEIGYVAEMFNDSVVVIKESTEEEIVVESHKWEEREHGISSSTGDLITYPVGTYVQIPLKIAYAVTIHKSQGLTLPSAVIQMGRGSFASGQTYVALSRIKYLDGFALMSKILNKDVIVDQEILDFYNDGCVGVGLDI